MKKLAFILLWCCFATAMHGQSPADLGVAAIGLVVSDIEKSEAFYTEVIGMEAAGEFSLTSAWSDEAGMAGGKPFSVKMFKMNSSPSATILKLAWFEETETRANMTDVGLTSGVNYLTLHYNDLAEVEKRVKDAGIDIVGRVAGEGYQLFIIKDPDGIYIELVGPA